MTMSSHPCSAQRRSNNCHVNSHRPGVAPILDQAGRAHLRSSPKTGRGVHGNYDYVLCSHFLAGPSHVPFLKNLPPRLTVFCYCIPFFVLSPSASLWTNEVSLCNLSSCSVVGSNVTFSRFHTGSLLLFGHDLGKYDDGPVMGLASPIPH